MYFGHLNGLHFTRLNIVPLYFAYLMIFCLHLPISILCNCILATCVFWPPVCVFWLSASSESLYTSSLHTIRPLLEQKPHHWCLFQQQKGQEDHPHNAACNKSKRGRKQEAKQNERPDGVPVPSQRGSLTSNQTAHGPLGRVQDGSQLQQEGQVQGRDVTFDQRDMSHHQLWAGDQHLGHRIPQQTGQHSPCHKQHSPCQSHNKQHSPVSHTTNSTPMSVTQQHSPCQSHNKQHSPSHKVHFPCQSHNSTPPPVIQTALPLSVTQQTTLPLLVTQETTLPLSVTQQHSPVSYTTNTPLSVTQPTALPCQSHNQQHSPVSHTTNSTPLSVTQQTTLPCQSHNKQHSPVRHTTNSTPLSVTQQTALPCQSHNQQHSPVSHTTNSTPLSVTQQTALTLSSLQHMSTESTTHKLGQQGQGYRQLTFSHEFLESVNHQSSALSVSTQQSVNLFLKLPFSFFCIDTPSFRPDFCAVWSACSDFTVTETL